MELTRRIVALIMLVAFALAQAPSPAECQMALGITRATCAMPCCRMPTAPVRCPMVKPAPAHDAIAPHPVTPWFGLQVLYTLNTALSLTILKHDSPFRNVLQTCHSLFLRAAPSARAPPSESILLSA